MRLRDWSILYPSFFASNWPTNFFNCKISESNSLSCFLFSRMSSIVVVCCFCVIFKSSCTGPDSLIVSDCTPCKHVRWFSGLPKPTLFNPKLSRKRFSVYKWTNAIKTFCAEIYDLCVESSYILTDSMTLCKLIDPRRRTTKVLYFDISNIFPLYNILSRYGKHRSSVLFW